MAGINRATIEYLERVKYENQHSIDNGKACVFISHKSTDMDAADAVAEYLMENDIDVYLDKMDAELQKKTREKDAQGIVDSINKALKYSTHILVLISDQTKDSWWVPYEIGYAKKGEKRIASALLVGYVDGFPDYLKIEKTIMSPNDFRIYARELKRKSRYGNLFEDEKLDKLDLYIRREQSEK